MLNTPVRLFLSSKALHLFAPTVNLMNSRSMVANITSNLNELKVVHDPTGSEFYIRLGNDKAFLQYTKCGNLMKLEETQVPDVFSGKGVGKILAKAAFDYCVENGYQMKLICTYLQHYYDKFGSKYQSSISN